MRFIAAAFSLVLSAALAAAQAQVPILNTPSGVEECRRTQLTWTNANPTNPGPVQIVVLPEGDPSANPLEEIGDSINGTSFSWLCKQKATTRIILRLRDNGTGQTSSTGVVVVGNGDPTLCAAAGSSSAASAPSGTDPAATTPAASSPAAPGTTPTPTTTAGGSTGTGTSKPQSSNTSKTSSGASSSPSGGAGQLKAPVALAAAAAFAMTVFA